MLWLLFGFAKKALNVQEEGNRKERKQKNKKKETDSNYRGTRQRRKETEIDREFKLELENLNTQG